MMSNNLSIAERAPDGWREISRVAGIDAGRLLESLVCELHWSALHVGAMSHLLNSSANSDASWTLRPWRRILNDNSKAAQLALRYFVEIGISETSRQSVSNLYSDVAEAKRATSVVMDKTTKYSAAERLTIKSLSSNWRVLSAQAACSVRCIEQNAGQRLDSLYRSDAQLIFRFLKEAESGDSRCVNAWGEISLPALSQRRREPRAATRQRCSILAANHVVPAILEDVSTSGLGVTCEHTFSDQQALVIDIGGRRLNATVVRRNGNQLGLLLEAPLAMNDDLFRKAKNSA